VHELLEVATGIDVRRSGPGGVQADLNIRGSTFEQTLVLIDGVRANDPQTGHHNLDIPLTPSDIERIEVLRGPDSRLYGPSAFAGVVNIITRKPEKPSITLGAAAGEHGFLQGHASLGSPMGRTWHRLTAARRASNGYRHNTDYSIDAVTYHGALALGRTGVRLGFGYIEKDFGANGFYSNPRPNQREHTTSLLTRLAGEVRYGLLSINSAAWWRHHQDDFVLDFEDPGLYRNVTVTNVLGGEARAGLRWSLGTLNAGVEGNWENVDSDDLGNHDRYRGGFFLDHPFLLWNRVRVTPGATAHYTTGQGWKVWPGLDLGVDITKWMRLFGSVDYSFRAPSFTELHYGSPYNRGDPDLEAERALTYEAGVRVTMDRLSASAAAFRREGRDVIDWVHQQLDTQWVASNVDEVDATGGEVDVDVRLTGVLARQPLHISLGYSFVDMDRTVKSLRREYTADNLPAGTLPDTVRLVYKYGTDYLRHKISARLDHALIMVLRFNWCLRYEVRHGENDGTVLFDTRMYLNGKRMSFYTEATNLFDVRYEDAGGIRMPGRWYKAGLSFTLTARPADEIRRPMLNE
jgi:iron complex outermembrane receptor protein